MKDRAKPTEKRNLKKPEWVAGRASDFLTSNSYVLPTSNEHTLLLLLPKISLMHLFAVYRVGTSPEPGTGDPEMNSQPLSLWSLQPAGFGTAFCRGHVSKYKPPCEV